MLSINPEDAAEKIDHLQTLFYNVHDLINQYRPHQARESLILMMEEQLDKFKAEIASVKQSKGKFQQLLKTVEDLGVENQDLGGKEPVKDAASSKDDIADVKRKELQKSQWAALHDELG